MAVLALAMAQVQPSLLEATIAEQRATWETAASAQLLAPGTVVHKREIDGVPVQEVIPPDPDLSRVVMHLHGGGYGIGSATTHAGFASRFAGSAGCRVVLPEYRLAPEHPFPAAVEDAEAVYQTLLREVGEPQAFAVSGDSAGGGLALGLLLKLRDGGGSLPGAVVCWSPWLDLSPDALDGPAHPDDPVLSREWLNGMASNYLDGADPHDAWVSPLRGELAGLPPTLILVGGRELLSRQSQDFAIRARTSGVEVEFEQVEGAIHLWMVWLPDAPESQAALQRSGAFLRTHSRQFTV